MGTVGLAQTGSKGFPVHVNPESTLYENTQAATNFGFVDIPVGLDEVNFVGNKADLAQTSAIPVDSSVVQATAPGDFNIVDQEAVDSTLVQTGKMSQKSATGLK